MLLDGNDCILLALSLFLARCLWFVFTEGINIIHNRMYEKEERIERCLKALIHKISKMQNEKSNPNKFWSNLGLYLMNWIREKEGKKERKKKSDSKHESDEEEENDFPLKKIYNIAQEIFKDSS